MFSINIPFDVSTMMDFYIGGNEIFKYCTYPGVEPERYMIGSNGTVINMMTLQPLISRIGTGGYSQLHLSIDVFNNTKDFMVHRLVAWEWIFVNRNLSFDVNHKDGIKTHNYFMNLEWVTHVDNVIHAKEAGLLPTRSGECNGRSVLNEDLVRIICELLQNPDTSYADIAKYIEGYGVKVSPLTIQAIANGKNWSYLTQEYSIPKRTSRWRKLNNSTTIRKE